MPLMGGTMMPYSLARGVHLNNELGHLTLVFVWLRQASSLRQMPLMVNATGQRNTCSILRKLEEQKEHGEHEQSSNEFGR